VSSLPATVTGTLAGAGQAAKQATATVSSLPATVTGTLAGAGQAAKQATATVASLPATVTGTLAGAGRAAKQATATVASLPATVTGTLAGAAQPPLASVVQPLQAVIPAPQAVVPPAPQPLQAATPALQAATPALQALVPPALQPQVAALAPAVTTVSQLTPAGVPVPASVLHLASPVRGSVGSALAKASTVSSSLASIGASVGTLPASLMTTSLLSTQAAVGHGGGTVAHVTVPLTSTLASLGSAAVKSTGSAIWSGAPVAAAVGSATSPAIVTGPVAAGAPVAVSPATVVVSAGGSFGSALTAAVSHTPSVANGIGVGVGPLFGWPTASLWPSAPWPAGRPIGFGGFSGLHGAGASVSRRGLSVRPVTPVPAPQAPAPGGSPFGTGVDSAAGGGSGSFFFGAVALLALAALFVPRVLRTLRTYGVSRAPSPFLLSLERPG